MNFSTTKLLFTSLHVLLLLILFTFPVIGTTRVRCLEKERFTLLKIKADMKDIDGRYSNWGTKEEEKDCCRWEGVQCDNKTNHVVGLHIYDTGGSISQHLGNLSMLRNLDLGWNPFLNITDLDWLSSLHLLEYLDLTHVDLSRATTWMQVIINLPSLNHLNLWNCNLPSTLNPSLPLINTSTSLSYMDLSQNSMSSTSILSQFLNVSRCFRYVDFSYNDMTGRIPDALGNLTFLSHVDLSYNKLEGAVPTALWNSTMLENLDLSENLLYSSLPNVLNLHNLETLNLYRNGFVGIVPDLTGCTSLRIVDFHDNKFNGTLTKGIGSLSELVTLDLSSNNLEGIINEVHLFNLSKLLSLDLYSNSNLTVKINSHWNPPFKLQNIGLAYCNLGPKFPYWILKACSPFAFVDISNAQISDTIEKSLWNSSICFLQLNMSWNRIYGMAPDLSCNDFGFVVVDLSCNEFSGSLPLLGPSVRFLNLARNNLSGTLTKTCEARRLRFLDLSKNLLSGVLPKCLTNFTELQYLNLANNFIYGEIPKSRGYLHALSSLHLRNNNFKGKFPTALRDCRGLHVLDLGENNFSGNIPIWVGTRLPNLAVLSLTSNEFYGGLPSTLCHLQNLRTLDLSLNKISGTIPKCIGNFSSMTSEPGPHQLVDDISGTFSLDVSGDNLFPTSPLDARGTIFPTSPLDARGNARGTPFPTSPLDARGTLFPTSPLDARGTIKFYDNIEITWKGKNVEYKRNLVLLKAIDLSCNNLSGQIPTEITSLHGLFALNISRNNMVGSIPSSIDQLELLNSLDLSENHLSGHIPDTLSQLSHLGVLNLSFNNLSSRIPWNTHMQTFDSFSYLGNPELCGHPLPKSCPEDHRTHNKSNSTNNVDTEDNDELITTGFYISMTLGFIFGFWGVLWTLILNKSCRRIWFKTLIYLQGKLQF